MKYKKNKEMSCFTEQLELCPFCGKYQVDSFSTHWYCRKCKYAAWKSGFTHLYNESKMNMAELEKKTLAEKVKKEEEKTFKLSEKEEGNWGEMIDWVIAMEWANPVANDIKRRTKSDRLEPADEKRLADEVHRVRRLIKKAEKKQASGQYVSFSGDDSCDATCAGWDGMSKRCQCGNRRVDDEDGYAEAY